jgi:glyoxylase I family protein
MKPLGLHHVSVNVPDVAGVLPFYTEVLGLTQRADRPDFGFAGAWLNAGDQQVHLIEAPTPPDLGQHLALAVGEMELIVAELRDAGVEVTDPVVVAKGLQAFLHDPCGNTIELYEPGSSISTT